MPGTKNYVKRFTLFLHYPNKWRTSPCRAMSHGLGSQPGNSWLGPSKVPEPTGKRLWRFVNQSSPPPVLLRGGQSVRLPQSQEFHSSQCAPPTPSRPADTVAAPIRL